MGSRVGLAGAFHPQLRHGQVCVAPGFGLGGIKVQQLQPHRHLLARLGAGGGFVGHGHAVAQQAVHFAVGGHQAHGGARLHHGGHGIVHRAGGGLGVQAHQGGPQWPGQNHLALVGTARAVVQVFRLRGEAVEHVVPTQVLQALQQGLLDVVFGNEVFGGQSACFPGALRWWCVGLCGVLRPLGLFGSHAGRQLDVEMIDAEFAGDEAGEESVTLCR